MKEFADDNFKFDENGGKFSRRVENTMGKGEIARDEQFLLFPLCFQKICTGCRHVKTRVCLGKGYMSFLTIYPTIPTFNEPGKETFPIYYMYVKRRKCWLLFPQCFQSFRNNLNHLSQAEPHSSIGSLQDLSTGGCWFDPKAWPIFFPWTDDSHCNRIHSSLITVHCFNNGYVGKQPVAWKKEYCTKYW